MESGTPEWTHKSILMGTARHDELKKKLKQAANGRANGEQARGYRGERSHNRGHEGREQRGGIREATRRTDNDHFHSTLHEEVKGEPKKSVREGETAAGL